MPKTQKPISQEDIDLCENMTEEEEFVVRDIISRAADKWSLWALTELVQEGPFRFSRLLDRVEGVSQKSLTATLRHLERNGLITRTVTVQVPIRVDYGATALGRAMVPAGTSRLDVGRKQPSAVCEGPQEL
ncbi:MAG: helix-turn-helix domain-containing protein [Bryobacteraceae bacterium]